MTLDQLRIFLAVAEHGHVTRAAAVLNLAQSSVSSAISALEARHDVALFNRVGRRIELSAEGRIFLDAARAVLREARQAETMLAELGGVRRGSLSVFASQTIANFWLPKRIVAFRERYPEIDLTVHIGNTAESAAAVHEGTAEIGLIEGEIDQPALQAELVDHDNLVLVVGRDHEWVARAPTLPADFVRTRWALREAGSGTRTSFERTLARLGLPPDALGVDFVLPSNESVCATVASSGRHATVVSESVARAGVEAGSLVVVPFAFETREFRLIRHRERASSRAAQAFVELLQSKSGKSA